MGQGVGEGRLPRCAQALPPDVAAYRWRVVGLPVLGYIVQLCEPPPGLSGMERRWVEQILRLPHNSLGAHAHLSVSDYGGPKVPSADAFVRAVATLAAATTFGELAPRECELRHAIEERGTLRQWVEGDYRPVGWDAHAMVTHLARARVGLLVPHVVQNDLQRRTQAVVTRALTADKVPLARRRRFRAVAERAVGMAVAAEALCEESVSAFLAVVRLRRGGGAYPAIRTVLDMWTTTTRLHSGVHVRVRRRVRERRACALPCVCEVLRAVGDGAHEEVPTLRHYGFGPNVQLSPAAWLRLVGRPAYVCGSRR